MTGDSSLPLPVRIAAPKLPIRPGQRGCCPPFTREGKTITYAAKEADILKFKAKKEKIETAFQKMVDEIKSTEVNKALDELEKKFPVDWRALMNQQYELYAWAKDKSNLEFDMWEEDWISDGYVWTTGAATTDAEVATILAGDLPLIDHAATSVK